MNYGLSYANKKIRIVLMKGGRKMADSKEKQATCPICGYTDTAGDAEALEEAMQEHMRLQHNQVGGVNPSTSDLKPTGQGSTDAGIEAPSAAAGTISPSGNPIAGNRPV